MTATRVPKVATGGCPVSVLVPTRNERETIEDCLRSVAWADEVFVVDSASTDGTAAVAERMGARVVQFEYGGGWPKKKNWALGHLPFRNEWILIVDADERVTPELAAEIAATIPQTPIDGFYIRWKYVFDGRWLRHCWDHGWMLRLLRRGSGEYEDLGMRGEAGWDCEVHENIVVEGATARLSGRLLHLATSKGLAEWWRKQCDFVEWNAVRRLAARRERWMPGGIFSADPLARRKALKSIFIRLPLRPLGLFLYLFAVKRGCLDGWTGWRFCALRARHEWNIGRRVAQLRRQSRAG